MVHVQLLRTVVVSSGDIQAEHKSLTTVLEELNGGICWQRKLWIVPVYWKTEAYSGFRLEGPQGLVNSMSCLEECDLLIGIFWKRLGMSPGDADNIEQAFLRAYDAWERNGSPHIMVYFNQRPATPKTAADAEQWRQVLAFRERLPHGKKGEYRGKDDFERQIRHSLSALFQNASKG